MSEKPDHPVQFTFGIEQLNRYGVIVADPPWSYTQYRDSANGAAKSAYSCLGLTELMKIPVWSWAAETCVMAMWCTNPKIEEGIALMRAWGFEYKTKVTWLKNNPKSRDLATGVGIWFQGNTEDILFGVRGKVGDFAKRRGKLGVLHGPRDHPDFWKRLSEQIVLSPKSKVHSKKPETLQDYLETFKGPYLELFATREKPGWDCWGYNTGKVLGPWGVADADTTDLLPPPSPARFIKQNKQPKTQKRTKHVDQPVAGDVRSAAEAEQGGVRGEGDQPQVVLGSGSDTQGDANPERIGTASNGGVGTQVQPCDVARDPRAGDSSATGNNDPCSGGDDRRSPLPDVDCDAGGVRSNEPGPQSSAVEAVSTTG